MIWRSLRLKPRESCLPQASRDLRVRMVVGYILQQSKKEAASPARRLTLKRIVSRNGALKLMV